MLDEFGLFAIPEQRTLAGNRIYLLEERADGRFGIRREYPLSGTV